MAAPRTNPLQLWPRGLAAGTNRPLGSILLTAIDWQGSNYGGLRLGVEYRPPDTETEPRQLVELRPVVTSAWPTRRGYGRVRLESDPLDQRGFLGPRTSNHVWVWALTDDEIEAIEAERAPNAAAEAVAFNLEVAGIASVGSKMWGFSGDAQFSLATSDWLSLLRSLGHITPPSLQDLAGQSMTLAPAWASAHEKFREARRHLALGEDREALAITYRLFDAIARNPFRAEWSDVLDAEMPPEKAKIVRDLLRANATALNKLGRHPADSLTDGRDRDMLTLDHWEAELLIAVSQLLLAAVERWRWSREAE